MTLSLSFSLLIKEVSGINDLYVFCYNENKTKRFYKKGEDSPIPAQIPIQKMTLS